MVSVITSRHPGDIGVGTPVPPDFAIYVDDVEVGDDITGDVQAAIDLAVLTGAKEIRLPAGSYDMDPIDLYGCHLIGAGRGITILNYDGAADLITSQGSISADIAVTANLAKGAQAIKITSTATFAAGDYFIVRDTVDFAPVTGPGYKSGEYARVLEVVDGDDMNLYSKVWGSLGEATGAYTTGNSSVVNKVTFVENPAVKHLTIVTDYDAASGFNVIFFEYARNPVVHDVEIKDWAGRAIDFRSCVNGVIDGNILDNGHDELPDFAGYGIVLSRACDNTLITRNVGRRMRHMVTTIGGSMGVCHKTMISDNMASECSNAPFDTHENCDGITFANNWVMNSENYGITVRAKNYHITGNQIFDVVDAGIWAHDGGTYGKIDNNRVIRAGSFGILLNASANTMVNGNYIEDAGAEGIRASTDKTGIANIFIVNNVINNFGAAFSDRSGIMTATDTQDLDNVVIANNFIQVTTGSARSAIRINDTTNLSAFGNRAKGTFSTGAFEIAGYDVDNKPVDGVRLATVYDNAGLYNVTAANLAAIAHAVNTTAKFSGKPVYETTNNRVYVASGPAAADPWDIADGGSSVTPS